MSLVITGNPGVGKHTIAKILAKQLDYEILDINEMVKEMMNDIGEKNSEFETIDVDVLKLKKIIESMEMMKSDTRTTIVVGHLAPYVLPESLVDKVFVLRKNPYKLMSVYKERGYSKKKSLENASSEILGIITYDAIDRFGEMKTIQVDTTDKTDSFTIKRIIEILNGLGEGTENIRNDTIDWLSLFSNKEKIENDLEEFFSYSKGMIDK